MIPFVVVVAFVTGALFAALGVFLLRRPGSPGGSRMLALFALGFSAVVFTHGFDFWLRPSPDDLVKFTVFISWFGPMYVAAVMLLAAALVGLVLRFPSPIGRGYVTVLVLVAALGLVEILLIITQDITREWESIGDLFAAGHTWRVILGLGTFVWHPIATGAATAALIVLAVRYRREGGASGVHARDHLSLAIATVLILFMPKGQTIVNSARWNDPNGLVSALMVIVVVGFWLWNAATAPSRSDARAPRNVAWLVLATVLAGMIVHSLQLQFTIAVVMAFGALFLIYAVLRHQFLGIDVKARWTVKRGTVAALIVATFFVVSELAKVLFEGLVNNVVIGILAAGMLVFAIAPLQRFASNLAEKAVPLSPIATGANDANDIAYRDALRFALRDRRLSRKEELQLANLADRLGIGAGRATKLRQQVDEELREGGGKAP